MTSESKKFDYEIKDISEDDREKIVDFLRSTFFKDEPLNIFLGLITDENPTCETLEEFTVGHIPDGVNLMAVKDNLMIGLCLSVPITKGAVDVYDCEHEKYNKLVRILDFAEKQCDPFEMFPECSKGLSVQVISVNTLYRGRGIAVSLLEKVSELAKQRGYEFITVSCTSLYSAKLVEKLKYELKYSLKYSEYKENGDVVFKPESPHTTLSVYMKRL